MFIIDDWLAVQAGKLRLRRQELELAEMAGTIAKESDTFYRAGSSDDTDWQHSYARPAQHYDWGTLDKIQRQAFRLYFQNPHARRVIRTFVKYVYGNGMSIEIMDKGLQKQWDMWMRRRNGKRRFRQVITNTFRDGECFMRFSKEKGGPDIRLLNPALIKQPDESTDDDTGQKAYSDTYGIRTNRKDVEKVLGYWYSPLTDMIKVDEVHHIKILVDPDIKRGISILYPIMPDLTRYQQWLSDRLMLNRIRSAIALIRRHKTPPQNVRTAAAEYTKTTEGGVAKQKVFRPGTIIDATEGIDYDFVAANIQAQDVKEDGRAVLLAIAAGAGLNEYMVSADASNANRASLQVTENDVIREMSDWQTFFAEEFLHIIYRVLAELTDRGADDLLEKVEVDIKFPIIQRGDILELSKALQIQRDTGTISSETMQVQLGLDPNVERQRLEEEQEVAAGFAKQETEYQRAREAEMAESAS